ncbi:putative Phosphohydrolase [Desulfamplus magnetovallimortis]|uniref:Putative Phosphohydrolase n=1 Tax=Desulfamplus magnetovallimortis TaxID=1246637 RepID=A0A1W1HB53_9BACT|nr:HD domain-containing protein [Desulfamplus magnetovallimortis]SLM29615.1 putative Phosphohydrolase [Desulfamplus magnetovallimortis]
MSELYPDLINSIKAMIERSEFEYASRAGSDSFLWEHTVYVSSMAMKIAYEEGVDPLIPVVTALFHDCGKFENGTYHDGDKPEEETAAEIAAVMLKETGFKETDITIVMDSLLSLYNEKRTKNINTRIVHDADFLVKFGYMGFANFFEKSVLRGMAISHSILKAMSKELTYAVCLEQNMFTSSGKKMAISKAKITMNLFKNYLQELKDAKIAEYDIREVEIKNCNGNSEKMDTKATIPLVLVIPRYCSKCGMGLQIEFGRDKGIKCEKLIANIGCASCGQESEYDFSFCLPELVAHNEKSG